MGVFNKLGLTLGIYLLLAAVPAVLEAKRLPPEAISYSAFLSKAEFDARFPGEAVQAANLLPHGWYVRYQHETLTYWFGPVRFRSVADDYASQLRGIVAQAQGARPELEGHTITVLALPEEARTAEDIPSEPERRSPGAPSAPEPPSLLERILGVFRRG